MARVGRVHIVLLSALLLAESDGFQSPFSIHPLVASPAWMVWRAGLSHTIRSRHAPGSCSRGQALAQTARSRSRLLVTQRERRVIFFVLENGQ